MKYISVKQAAELWNLSERSVRNYCAQGRIEGAFLTGKTWNIPENATKPTRAATAKKRPPPSLRYSRTKCRAAAKAVSTTRYRWS